MPGNEIEIIKALQAERDILVEQVLSLESAVMESAAREQALAAREPELLKRVRELSEGGKMFLPPAPRPSDDYGKRARLDRLTILRHAAERLMARGDGMKSPADVSAALARLPAKEPACQLLEKIEKFAAQHGQKAAN